MRLPVLLCASGLASLLIHPATAQSHLPSRVAVDPLASMVTVDAPPPVTEWWKNGGPRVRPTDGRTRAFLKSGSERSSLLRELLDTIEGGNVVVYLGLDSTLSKKGLAGRLTFTGDAGKYRYVRASINPDLTADQIIASIAHELHHVTEIVEHPEVRSESDLRELYQRIGRENRASALQGWETDAAQQVTHDVRRELHLGRANAVALRDAGRKGAIR
jgi:hypothetical protein